MTEDWQNGGFGLYVHWPFCEAKCPYCDFNSHVVAQVDQTRWAEALAREIRLQGEKTEGRALSSIFFGGGTPSLMLPETVETVLRASRDHWAWANDIEITMEANPRSVEAARFEGYARAGVNRVSMGIQALNDPDLRRLGRLHSAAEAQAAFQIARQTFGRVSFDLIYARQNQSLDDWRAELSTALDMAADHLSLYQLTIEEGTAFWDRARAGGLRGLPDDDLAADMYEVTQKLCTVAGMPAYEVSNHAKPGAESRHNLIYWRNGDWAAVGPGAHGRLTINGQRHAFDALKMPKAWLDAAEGGATTSTWGPLSLQDHVGEAIMMGLRVREGIDVDRVRRLSDHALPQDAVQDLVQLGMLWSKEGRVGATLRGRMVLNSVIERLLPD
ncbi:radical SAM family heme chaperone HemW [Aestuariicoccus sp. MJ-SS9]|uniref:radical SAM family heme chaperone HemW n=1 Tax=Aestuariicoccus sp. MJ-SS9 TaxID=3079855 RepID=UPI00290FB1AA|nr:radical SAM family heme chaperone HemW [Aestuariicoccus sp. MJ-SS9]MDU8910905.1 radical SAM family heme chaperone HemW [Aestuariicoccus sp. MJ-SS9]